MASKFLQCLLLSLLWIFTSCASHSESESHEDEEHDHEGIALEPHQAAEFGIEYETVIPGSFHDVIKTSGSISPASSDVYAVTAKKSGIITLAPGISEGTPVNSGERIAVISSEGVEGGDISGAAKANLEVARKEYQRLKPLYEEGLVTASVFREAERAYREAEALAGSKSPSGSVVLTSPSSGTLQSLNVRSGEFVEVGSPVAIVAKNANLVLKADLPAREARHLSELESANFLPEGGSKIAKLSELNGRKITGSSSGASNGYIPVYFNFSGNPLEFPGGYAEVYLLCAPREGVISVPRDALLEIQGNKYVYAYDGDHGYEKILVKTGASDGDRVEIIQGLEEGERIVSKGASVIRMAEVSSIAPPAHNHSH